MLLNAPPPTPVHAALLVDADNFHHAEQLRAIHSQFGQVAGKSFLCYVYGDVKVLSQDALRPVWQEMAARLLPCLPLNKNTTDAMLIIDAMLLYFQQGVRRFGIASGDADFAPLALQLRTLGCEVTGFARKSIAFEAMVSYYDLVVRFDVPLASTPAPVPVKVPSSVPVVPSVAPVAAATVSSQSLPAVKPPAVAKIEIKPAPTSVKAAVPPQNVLADDVEDVRKILAALPPWRPHTVRQLNLLGAPLREAGIKKGNAPLHQLFRQYPDFFTVLPLSLDLGIPRHVRLERLP